MQPYIFPKTRHVRKIKPKRVFKNYRRYKPILQAEFARTCVYCRQPDSQAKGQVYGVDHYLPKCDFPAKACEYENLYYCCNTCNSYKKDHWHKTPSDERVLNPCDDELAKHIRFEKNTGKMVPTTKQGQFFEELFRLNEEDAPKQRLATLECIDLASQALAKAQKALGKARLKLASAADPVEVDRLASIVAALEERVERANSVIHRQSGTLPLTPLSSRHI